MKVGILGCGFIGTTIAGAIQHMEEVESLPLVDSDYEAAVHLGSSVPKARIFKIEEMDDFIGECDIVVEAASHQAVLDYGPRVVSRGKDLMILSVGALVDDMFWDGLKEGARMSGSRLYIPSGAVAGIDGLVAVSEADIDCVSLTVIKPPKGLSLPSSLHHLSGDLVDLKESMVIFEGSAYEAVQMFPKNVNVAATIALSGIGFKRTLVKVVVDPKATRNRHKVEVRGRFGEMRVEMMNLPSTTNPRTSYLAPLSAIATIKRIITGVSFGT